MGCASFRERHRIPQIVMNSDFPNEFTDMLDCLDAFSLKRSYIATPGGSRSLIPRTIDGFLRTRGWREKSFRIDIKIDEQSVPIPTHKIDNFKNRVGVELDFGHFE